MPLSVLIAGAGMAGLAAAQALEARGAHVTVVDARARVGGRVHTIRDLASDQHAEGGADLIESDHDAVRALAAQLDLKLVPILTRGLGYYGPDRAGRCRRQTIASGLEPLRPAMQALVRDYQLGEQRWDSGFAQRVAQRSVAEWVREQARRPGVPSAAYLVERMRAFRGLFLADPEELSLLALVDYFSDDPFTSAAELVRVAGGNDLLASKLAASLRTPPLLNHTIRRVRHDARGIRATVESARTLDEMRADYLIVAVPPPALRRIAFTPALPAVQQRAYRTIRMGPASRLLLQFERRFWRHKGQPDLFGTSQEYGAVWDGSQEQRTGPAVLSLLAGGRASEALQHALTRGGPESIVRRLRWLGKPTRLLHSRLVRWESDPWAGGGYAVFDRTFDPLLRDWLARPHGRIRFAGEHTHHRYQGYVNGAILSGQRAATELP